MPVHLNLSIHRNALLYVLIISVCGLVCWQCYSGSSNEKDIKVFQNPLDEFLFPVQLPPTAKCPFSTGDNKELEVFIENIKLKPNERASASHWLHLVRLLGAEMKQEYKGRKVTALELFFDAKLSRDYFGSPAFGVTRHGVRYKATGNDNSSRRFTQEVHRDQCLAIFAELGLPLSTPLTGLGKQTFTLEDAIRDSKANFHLGQDELAWTALAYALYCPNQPTWKNKFNEEFSFDELALTLLERPLSDRPCAGVHVATALTALYLVNGEYYPILSQRTEEQVDMRLEELVVHATYSQLEDGSWPFDWHASPTEMKRMPRSHQSDQLVSKLIATSHLLEWLTLVRSDFQVPCNRLTRAHKWLYRMVQRDENGEFRFDIEDFCPASHTAIALGL